MNRLMRYIQHIKKWTPFKAKRQETVADLMNIVEQEVEMNPGTTLIVRKYGQQMRSRNIYIPLQDGTSVMLRRVGRRCQVKKGDAEFDIDPKAFAAIWRRCVDKKYKYILK